MSTPINFYQKSFPTTGELILGLDFSYPDYSVIRTDLSTYAHSVAAISVGHVQVSNEQSIVGSSVKFDGFPGSILSITNHTVFDMATLDFKFELYWYSNSIATRQIVFSKFNDAAATCGSFYIAHAGWATGQPNTLRCFISTDGVFANMIEMDSEIIVGNGMWYYISLGRANSTITFTVENNLRSVNIGTAPLFYDNRVINISSYRDGAGLGSDWVLNGWIDQLYWYRNVTSYSNTNPVNYYAIQPTSGIAPDTVLFAEFEGADGSTTFLDSSPAAHTLIDGGAAVIDTAEKKVGNSSGLFGGIRSSFVKSSDSNDWNFGSGDFTISLWAHPNNLSGTRGIISQWGDGGTTGAWYLYMQAGGEIRFAYSTGSEVIIPMGVGFAVSSWNHIEIGRSGNNLYFFRNGTLGLTTAISSIAFTNSTFELNISGYANGTGAANQAWLGWIDNVEIIKGRAKHTSSFNTADPTTSNIPVNFYGN